MVRPGTQSALAAATATALRHSGSVGASAARAAVHGQIRAQAKIFARTASKTPEARPDMECGGKPTAQLFVSFVFFVVPPPFPVTLVSVSSVVTPKPFIRASRGPWPAA